MAASAPRALAAGLALSGPLDTQRTCWAPCFADLETEAHRGQRLAQQGPGWGPGPLVRLQGLGSMLTLDEMGGRRAPWGPQGHPSPPGRCAGGPPRMNGPVTWAAHFKGRAWGGAGQEGAGGPASLITALQPRQSRSQSPWALRTSVRILPLVTQGRQAAPALPAFPLLPGPAQPRGPGLSAQGGAAGARGQQGLSPGPPAGPARGVAPVVSRVPAGSGHMSSLEPLNPT